MPASSGAEFTFADRSRKVVTVDPETARIVPRFSTTKKRDESPGACTTSSGWSKRVAPNASRNAIVVQPASEVVPGSELAQAQAAAQITAARRRIRRA